MDTLGIPHKHVFLKTAYMTKNEVAKSVTMVGTQHRDEQTAFWDFSPCCWSAILE